MSNRYCFILDIYEYDPEEEFEYLKVPKNKLDIIHDIRSKYDCLLDALNKEGEDAIAVKVFFEEYRNFKGFEEEYAVLKYSETRPDLLFVLNAKNESDDTDQWKSYFQNGRVQICQANLIFDEFHHQNFWKP